MLAELKALHEELVTVMTELDGLTRWPAPDKTAVAGARARLGRASGRRRGVFDAACNAVIGIASASEAETLKRLREVNAAQLAASTNHIGSWGLRELVEDWPEYVRTAAPMRQSMRDLIAKDREILFPLLERLERTP